MGDRGRLADLPRRRGQLSLSTLLCPAADLGEGLRFLLRTSARCLVREIEFSPPAQREIIERLLAWRTRAAAGS
jgi:hypothetical protein